MTCSVSSSNSEDLLSITDSPPLPKQSKRRLREREELTGSHVRDLLNSLPDEQPTELKQRRTLKVLEPLIELSGDEVYSLGLQTLQGKQRELMETLDDDLRQTFEKSQQEVEVGVRLKKAQYQEIDQIRQTKSEEIGSQFFELYQLLTSKRCINKLEGQAILELAREIIEEVPNKIVLEETDPREIGEKAQLLSEKFLEKLPFSAPEGSLQKLAAALQKALDTEGDDPMDLAAEDERGDSIEIACIKLGHLLFLAQRDIPLTVNCIGRNNVEEALNRIADQVEIFLEQAADRIHAHGDAHLNVSIQSVSEAVLSKMSIEMAKMLLLDTGSINFGIIDAVAKKLIPESFVGTVADKELKLILTNLASSPQVWQIIAQASPPESREIPSDLAIRAHLGLAHDYEITQRDAQVFILSAIFHHFRQAHAGTCFTNAPFIKILFSQLHLFAADLAEMTRTGYLERSIYTDVKKFPFRARVTNEYLDVLITTDGEGKMLSTRRYDLSLEKAYQWPEPASNAHLSDAPGIKAACQALKIVDVNQAILTAIDQLAKTFSVNELLRKLAAHAFQLQEAAPYALRNQVRFTIDELYERAQFAFGVQTNHPLHRAYEQIGASMVYYFGANYGIPSLVGMKMRDLLKKASKSLPALVRAKHRELVKKAFLPLVTRMRYLYNPNIEDPKILFDDGNQGTKDHNNYGYELYDTGLPNDFVYSTKLLDQFDKDCSHLHFDKFRGFAPPTTWKPVKTEETFREFLVDVIRETAKHFQNDSETLSESAEWNAIAQMIISEVSKKTFTTKLIHQLFGRGSELKKEHKKNEFTMSTKPWSFRWGGDFKAVLKTFYGFTRNPIKFSPYQGSPREVLAKCINYVKGQSELMREGLEDPYNPIVITAPGHCFLLRPFEETYKQAWKSELSANEYIAEHVEIPGLKLCKKIVTPEQRDAVIELIAGNLWYTRNLEHDDWERQQLTETSKQILDQKIQDDPTLFNQTAEEFKKSLFEMGVRSRAEDPNIDKRNQPWENRFLTALNNLFEKLVLDNRRARMIKREVAYQLIDFVRNRQDTVKLSNSASERFQELMEEAPEKCSMKEFRDFLVDAAHQARIADIHRNEKEWKVMIAERVDTKLFSLLSERVQKRWIATGIVTHDTNWKYELNAVHFIFMVNPGTERIELCRFIPDTGEVRFTDQKAWFPRHSGHGSWRFPDNYLVWPHAPLFNVNKMMLGK